MLKVTIVTKEFLSPPVPVHVRLLGVAFCLSVFPSVWDWTKIHQKKNSCGLEKINIFEIVWLAVLIFCTRMTTDAICILCEGQGHKAKVLRGF